MKKYLLATASVLAITHGASAADMAVKAPRPLPAALWAGCYLGVQGGVVSHRGEFSDLNFDFRTHPSTKIGGAVGVNAACLGQSGSFVYGVDADWMWVAAKAQTTWGFPSIFATQLTTSFDPNWIATVRGRMGLAFDATLVYITGGVAFGHVRNSADRFVPATPTFNQSWSENTTRVGWTMGFGVAHQFSQNWSVRAEGRYIDLGKRTVDCTTTGPAINCFIGGANYRGEFTNSLFMGLVALDFKF